MNQIKIINNNKKEIFGKKVNLCNLMFKTFDFSNLDYLMNRIHSFKYLRSTKLGCKDIKIKKSEFVAKIKFLSSC